MYPSSLPNIDLQVLPTFPANVVATGAVDISKSGLAYTFGLNFQNVIEETNVSDMSKREVLVQDTDTGAFRRVKLSNLPAGKTGLAEIPQEFVAGLTLGNWSGDAAKTNWGVTIAPGQCRGNGVTASRTATWAKMLNATWVQGFGYGGLDTGTIQPNTTYHCHAIRANSTGDLDFLFSTSATSPVMPSGWTRVQRLGAVLTGGSGNIWPFVQSGNTFLFNSLDGAVVYSSTTTRAKAPLSVVVPNGVRVQGLFQAVINTAGSNSYVHMYAYDGLYTNARDTAALRSSGGEVTGIIPLTAFTNTSQQIQLEVTNNPHPSNPCSLRCLGWIDYQIPRIG